MKHRTAFLLGLTIGAAILAILFAGMALGYKQAESADITVLPCSAWAHTSHPHIPPFTFAGACALPDGSLSVPTP